MTLVKSFKWLAGQTEYQNAIDYVNSLPEQMEGSTATTIEELIAEDEAYKKTLKYKVKKLFDDEGKSIKETVDETVKNVEEIKTETGLEIENNAQE